MEELMSFIQNDLFEKRYSYFDSIVFDNTNVIVYKVDTVSDYLKILKKYNNNEVDMYFRGLWDKEKVLGELRYYKMNNQICIVNQKTLNQLITFKRAYEVECNGR